MLTERDTLAYFTRTQQWTLSMFMLMLTLLAVTIPEDPPPVTLFYSITVVSPGSQRNNHQSPNQLPKQNSLPCPTLPAIFDGFWKASPTFAFMFQSLCMLIIPVEISWLSTLRSTFEQSISLSTSSSRAKLWKPTCSFSLKLNQLTILLIYAPKSWQNLRISEWLLYWAVDNVGKCWNSFVYFLCIFNTLPCIALLSLCFGSAHPQLTLLQPRYILWCFIIYFRIICLDLTCAFQSGVYDFTVVYASLMHHSWSWYF